MVDALSFSVALSFNILYRHPILRRYTLPYLTHAWNIQLATLPYRTLPNRALPYRIVPYPTDTVPYPPLPFAFLLLWKQHN